MNLSNSSRLQDLARQWREKADRLRGFATIARAEDFEQCADALDAALADDPPAQEAKCAICGKPATCFGLYEDPNGTPDYACDECCGHGNEDGRCLPLTDPALDKFKALFDPLEAEANAIRAAPVVGGEQEISYARLAQDRAPGMPSSSRTDTHNQEDGQGRAAHRASTSESGVGGSSGWHAIETAPKDGRPIIAFQPGGTFPNGISYPANVGVAHWREADSLNPGLWDGPYNPRDYPTHWQPLPPAPALPAPPVEGAKENDNGR